MANSSAKTARREALDAPQARMSEAKSQGQVVWEQFRKHKLALAGGAVLILLFLMAIFAPFIAPDALSEYSRTNITANHPPTAIHVFNPETGELTRPFVYGYERKLNMETFQRTYEPILDERYPIHFFVEGSPYKILGLFPGDIHLFGVEEPGEVFLFGADSLGRDLFTRNMYAAQFSLSIGILASFITVIIAMVLGGLAGYYGGWIDEFVMRLVEITQAIPYLFLLLTLRALFPIDINPILVLYVVIGILAVVGWGGLARVIRSQLLSTREIDYVTAASSLGAKDGRIIFKHMMPAIYGYIIVDLTLLIPRYILLESGLSFLGLGVVEPYASWGSLLAQAQAAGFAIADRPWLMIPGLFIVLTVLCFQLMGDGLRDAFDPRKRR